jgi:hypothetical protein
MSLILLSRIVCTLLSCVFGIPQIILVIIFIRIKEVFKHLTFIIINTQNLFH